MKWLLKISYSWGDEEPYQEFNSFKEAWDTAKKDACNEAEIASIEANDETCEIGLTFEKEEDRGRISLHYTYDNSYCYYDVLPQEVTEIVRESPLLQRWDESLLICILEEVLYQNIF